MDRLASKTQLDRLYILANKLVRLLGQQGYEFDVPMLDSERPPEDVDDRSDEGFHEDVSWPPLTARELRDILTETQSTRMPPAIVEVMSDYRRLCQGVSGSAANIPYRRYIYHQCVASFTQRLCTGTSRFPCY